MGICGQGGLDVLLARAQRGDIKDFVIEVVSAQNVPSKDWLGNGDPFFKMWLVGAAEGEEEKKGPVRETIFRNNTHDPTFRCIRNLGDFQNGDMLHLEAYDYDWVKYADKVLDHEIPIEDITTEPTEFELGEGFQKKPVIITLRRVPGPHVKSKQLFIIRHGESKWNHAQDSMQFHKMLAYDHALNHEGIEQAESLNALYRAARENGSSNSLEQQFFNADQVFSSPLTRALQTCLLGLETHPAMAKGVTLLASAREKKGQGGLDTVGIMSGVADIKKRAASELQGVWGEQVFEEKKSCLDVKLIEYDAGDKWWTPVEHRDDAQRLAARINDLCSTLHYSDFKTGIVTGHSLFFRELCKTKMSPEFEAANPEFAKQLKKHKMNNAACLAIKMEWPDPEDEDSAVITDYKFLFGSGLKGVDSPDDEKEEEE